MQIGGTLQSGERMSAIAPMRRTDALPTHNCGLTHKLRSAPPWNQLLTAIPDAISCD